MNTGVKIAIGCGIAALLAGLAAAVLVGGAFWWVKDKAGGMIAEQEQIEALKAEVNARPWDAPADGIVAEDRLQAYLEIRNRVRSVYSEYQDLLEKKQGEVDLGDVARSVSMLTELRRAQAQAQADLGMGDEEYTWLTSQVYASAWASRLEEATGETTAAGVQAQAVQALEEQLAQAEGLPDEQRAALEQQLEQMRAAAASSEGQIEVPEENIELFRRYREQIEEGAMPGLELLAL